MNLVSNAAVSIASGGMISAIALSTVLFGFGYIMSRVKTYPKMNNMDLEKTVRGSFHIIINSNPELN